MPRRTTLIDNAYYHVFNRGVEKRTIFQDGQDYQTFIDILTYYLKFTKKSPLNTLKRIGLASTGIYQDKIKLVAYCLMSNHFHLLLHQKEASSLPGFMQRIGTTYARYFNQRHNRVGILFQNRFKAKHLDTEPYLLHTSKYIHRNPTTEPGYVNYRWSSYRNFLYPNERRTQVDRLLQPQDVLDYFSKINPQLSYKGFVEESDLADWYIPTLKWLK